VAEPARGLRKTLPRNARKPPGWGSLGRRTGNGRHRVQLCLVAADRGAMARLGRSLGLAHGADVVRYCLRSQKAALCLPATAAVVRRRAATATACGMPAVRAGEGGISRWSQWVGPDDLAHARALLAAHGLRSLSEAVRFALRMEDGRVG
jgi:hypothetical protein